MQGTQKNALISVSDKRGLGPFANALHGLGYMIISTGNTAVYLRDEQIPCQEVAEFTGVEEIFAGRVKTLHLRLCAGVLFEPTSSQQQREATRHDIVPISVVVINFYPLSSSVDNIDIGGPTLLRAAAKNYRHVVAVCDPADYQQVISNLQDNGIDEHQRRRLAERAFRYSANYEQQICQRTFAADEHQLTVPLRQLRKLRYGENPNQQASIYVATDKPTSGFANIEQLQGTELSYNNLLDLDAGTRLVQEFNDPAVAIIKHNNPCGVTSSGNDLSQLFAKALAGDRRSAFGGVIVTNRLCTAELAEIIGKSFYEVLLAVGVEDSARQILINNKRLRVVVAPWLNDHRQQHELRTVTGAYLYQQCPAEITDSSWRITNQQSPLSPEQNADLLFAARVVAHLRSNAIVIAKDRQLLACCGGQTSRIDAVQGAVRKGVASGHHLRGSVLASDGFFPFNDWLAPVAEQGIVAVIQPGGSIRDQESIDACHEHGITMVFSGQRSFRH